MGLQIKGIIFERKHGSMAFQSNLVSVMLCYRTRLYVTFHLKIIKKS